MYYEKWNVTNGNINLPHQTKPLRMNENEKPAKNKKGLPRLRAIIKITINNHRKILSIKSEQNILHFHLPTIFNK